MLLEAPDVGTAVERRRLGGLPVVLQIDLDPLAVLREQCHQVVVLGDRESVGVEQDAYDRPRDQRVEQLGELRIERRLTARQHHDVEATVLPREPGVDVGEHLLQRCDRRQCGSRGGEEQYE